ncbi:hypothetical protein Emag_006518 [Eimeria magna]
MEESPPKPWQQQQHQQQQQQVALPFASNSGGALDVLSLASPSALVTAPDATAEAESGDRGSSSSSSSSSSGVAVYSQPQLTTAAAGDPSVFGPGFGGYFAAASMGQVYGGGGLGCYGNPYGSLGGYYPGYGMPSYLSNTMESLARVSALLHAQGFFLDHICTHTSLLQQHVISLRGCMRSLAAAAAAAAAKAKGRFIDGVSVAVNRAGEGAKAAAAAAVAAATAAPDVIARQQQLLLQQLLPDLCLPDDECSTADSSNSSSSINGEGEDLHARSNEEETASIKEALLQLVSRIRRLSAVLLLLLAVNMLLLLRRRRARVSQ